MPHAECAIDEPLVVKDSRCQGQPMTQSTGRVIWAMAIVACVGCSSRETGGNPVACASGGAAGKASAQGGGTASGGNSGGSGAGAQDISLLAPIPYGYENVPILGGGFVTGLTYHPTVPGLLYAQTDISGAFRWDGAAASWVPLLDWVGHDQSDLMGIEGLALDPNHAERIYLAAGMYAQDFAPPAAILRSDDQGATWQRLPAPFKVGGNEPGRGMGERLLVDPSDSDVLFFGSRLGGLWKSSDRARTWQHVDSFPPLDGAGAVGIGSLIFDADGSTLYAGIARQQDNLYRSADGGKTWLAVPGAPEGLMPHRMALAGTTLVLSYTDSPGPYDVRAGAVYKLELTTDAWTNITPLPGETNFGYGGVSTAANDPNLLMVATLNRYASHEEIFRSRDAGVTWQALAEESTWDPAGASFLLRDEPGYYNIHWVVDLDMNPFDAAEVSFVTGAGVWRSTNANANAVDSGAAPAWAFFNHGLENTGVEQLLSPSVGAAHLVSLVGDVGGFWHEQLDAPALTNHQGPRTQALQAADSAGLRPEQLVRVGYDGVAARLVAGISEDSGQTWTPLDWLPQGILYHKASIALSADGQTILWMAPGGQAFRSTSRGSTWSACTGLPPYNGSLVTWTNTDPKVAADRVNPQLFYAFDVMMGSFFVSTDGGVTFERRVADLPQHPDYLARDGTLLTVSGEEGDVWLTTVAGLFHSVDGGRSFAKLNGIAPAYALAAGQAAAGASYPALYVAGALRGEEGLFRSDDGGASWARINADQQQFGGFEQLAGDPRVFGRVYVGTFGRGILFGDPL